MNPIIVGGMTLAGTELQDTVIYVFQLFHLTAPPPKVAAVFGVLAVMGAHQIGRFIAARFPMPTAPASASSPAAATGAAATPAQP